MPGEWGKEEKEELEETPDPSLVDTKELKREPTRSSGWTKEEEQGAGEPGTHDTGREGDYTIPDSEPNDPPQ